MTEIILYSAIGLMAFAILILLATPICLWLALVRNRVEAANWAGWSVPAAVFGGIARVLGRAIDAITGWLGRALEGLDHRSQHRPRDEERPDEHTWPLFHVWTPLWHATLFVSIIMSESVLAVQAFAVMFRSETIMLPVATEFVAALVLVVLAATYGTVLLQLVLAAPSRVPWHNPSPRSRAWVLAVTIGGLVIVTAATVCLFLWRSQRLGSDLPDQNLENTLRDWLWVLIAIAFIPATVLSGWGAETAPGSLVVIGAWTTELFCRSGRAICRGVVTVLDALAAVTLFFYDLPAGYGLLVVKLAALSESLRQKFHLDKVLRLIAFRRRTRVTGDPEGPTPEDEPEDDVWITRQEVAEAPHGAGMQAKRNGKMPTVETKRANAPRKNGRRAVSAGGKGRR